MRFPLSSLVNKRKRQRQRRAWWKSSVLSNKLVITISLLVLVGFVCGYIFQANLFFTPSKTKIEKNQKVLPPVLIRIPSLAIETDVESVAKDKEGRMDVPKNVKNTAWYNLGPKPGEMGNAVIAGHMDTPTGKPAIFHKLATLKKGETIEVVDAGETTYIYRVTKIATYPVETFPIENVFGPYTTARLNLITCAGDFDQEVNTYSERTVVYSELTKIQRKD